MKNPTKIQALASIAARQPLTSFAYEPKPLGEHDIEIAITHCGICHSDLHLIDNDWQISAYPLVPGHEVVGTVLSRGSQVKHLEIGARVGVGWQRSACLQCEVCIQGDENYCANNQATCVANHGGFADRLRTDSRFAFAIPANLSSAGVAPLLCGGITVFSAMQHHGVTSNMHVAVAGLGGLGHLAVKFARAFGCEVSVISTTAAKEADAKRLGAHHFVHSGNPTALAALPKRFDFILSTVFAPFAVEPLLQTLKLDGKLCLVGAPGEPLALPTFPLLLGRRSICGSAIGGRPDIRQMLDFASRHKIESDVETVPLNQANEALIKLRNNQARYRLVLENN